MKKFIYALVLSCFVAFTTESCKENVPVSKENTSEDVEKPAKKKNKSKGNIERTRENDALTLDEFIEAINEELPEDLGDGQYLNTVYMEGAYCVMEIVADGNQVNVYEMDFSGLTKYDRFEFLDFMSDDADVIELLNFLVSNNRGLCMRWVDDMSGDYVDLKFSAAELKDYLAIKH